MSTTNRSGTNEIMELSLNPKLFLTYYVYLCLLIFLQIIIFTLKGQSNSEWNCYLDVILLLLLIISNIPIAIVNLFLIRKMKGANAVLKLDKKTFYVHSKTIEFRTTHF